MSMFLPEQMQQPQASGASFASASETTDGDVALMQRVLAAASRNPNLIPADFMAYVFDYIQISRLQVPISQVFGFRQTTTMAGVVNANGVIKAGFGFSVSHSVAGRYNITFTNAYNSQPSIVATVLSVANTYMFLTLPSPTGFQMDINDTGGLGVDEDWNFLAFPTA